MDALSAFVILSFNFMYNWIDPKTPVPADNTALRMLTKVWLINSFSAMAQRALTEEINSIGILNLAAIP
jgi:hypothetical protein